MYLHLGQDTIVRESTVLGIFDLDNCSSSHLTRDFLKKTEQAGNIQSIHEDIPKSFILTGEGSIKDSTVYLSQLSTATLKGRSNIKEAIWQN